MTCRARCGASLSSQHDIAACAYAIHWSERCRVLISCSLACLSSAVITCPAFSEAWLVSLHSAGRTILHSLKPGFDVSVAPLSRWLALELCSFAAYYHADVLCKHACLRLFFSSCYPSSVTHIRRLASRSPRCCRVSAAQRALSEYAEVQARLPRDATITQTCGKVQSSVALFAAVQDHCARSITAGEHIR